MFPGVASRLSVASVELSEFVNGESFVGRELARRVVSASSAKEYGRCDDDDESLILLLLHHSCCVRFFSWIESTYVPSYLLSSYSSVRSLCLESVGTNDDVGLLNVTLCDCRSDSMNEQRVYQNLEYRVVIKANGPQANE